MSRLFVGIGIILCLLVIPSIYLYHDINSYLGQPLPINAPQKITISAGMHFNEIIERLKTAGLIEKPYYLQLLAHWHGWTTKIKSGEYLFQPDSTPRALLVQLTTGLVIQHKLQLLEGWRFHELISAVHRHPKIRRLLVDVSPAQVMIDIGYGGISAEGAFFPDTYHFPAATTDIAFLRRAFHLSQQVLHDEWQQRAASIPYQIPYDALIMASIIEKETAHPDERDDIAGVFIRRINKNMKLQSDPSVIYAMGDKYRGNIRKHDLAIDSPYNTYRRRGLPPTPIALAGREAIHAALHPAAGTALYFVARGDGQHHFSDTLQEHNVAVRTYQLKLP